MAQVAKPGCFHLRTQLKAIKSQRMLRDLVPMYPLQLKIYQDHSKYHRNIMRQIVDMSQVFFDMFNIKEWRAVKKH